MIRWVLGTVLGVVIASVVVFAIEFASHIFYPPPPDLATRMAASDPAAKMKAVADYVRQAPLPAIALIPTAWIVGTFLGALAGTAIAGGRTYIPAAIVGGLILLGTVMNLAMITHPLWVAVVGVAGVPAAAYSGWGLARLKPDAAGPQPYDMRQKNMAC